MSGSEVPASSRSPIPRTLESTIMHAVLPGNIRPKMETVRLPNDPCRTRRDFLSGREVHDCEGLADAGEGSPLPIRSRIAGSLIFGSRVRRNPESDQSSHQIGGVNLTLPVGLERSSVDQ